MKHGYARVPAIAQDLIVQNEELKKEGCEIIFEEKFTGTKTDRPQYKQLLKELQEGDTLLVPKLNHWLVIRKRELKPWKPFLKEMQQVQSFIVR